MGISVDGSRLGGGSAASIGRICQGRSSKRSFHKTSLRLSHCESRRLASYRDRDCNISGFGRREIRRECDAVSGNLWFDVSLVPVSQLEEGSIDQPAECSLCQKYKPDRLTCGRRAGVVEPKVVP